MSGVTKDWLERLFWLVVFTTAGVVATELGDMAAPWAVVVAVVLQQVRNFAAVRRGDPNTVGFTDTRGG